MRHRASTSTGLEAAPDIMLLTMAALMVAIVWLVSHAQELTLPPIELPGSDAASLGQSDAAGVNVTLRPADDGGLEVWLEDARVDAGLDGLADALAAAGAGAVTLRADARTPWQDGLAAMNAAARLGLPVSVAAEP